MSAISGLGVGALVLVAGVGLSLYDLQSDARHTIVVYTTPALRDLLEKGIIPRFERETGFDVSLVYIPAGQQYNRLRMSGGSTEADLFLHASPLFLEKGYAEGHVAPFLLEDDAAIPDTLKGARVPEGRAWYAFAWSPLVEVFPATTPSAPDLASSDASFGFAHPVLSNNGVYNVILFEGAGGDAGRRALERTRSQPTNARANIGGVADGSFDLTLGYEAVVRFYQQQGAKVAYELPLLDGERVTTPVLCSVSLIAGQRNPAADELARFLFTDQTQQTLSAYSFRSVRPDAAPPAGAAHIDAAEVRELHYDWTRWRALEETLTDYEVR